MEGLLRAPAAGRGVVALVEGEAGIGKSALLQELLSRARAKGWEVLVATAEELDHRRPFALAEAALGPVEAAEARSWGGAAGITRPYVEAAVAETLIARLEALAAGGPLVLALEDVQWADSASLAVVGRLARRLAQLAVLVLVTARPFPRTASLDRLVLEAVPRRSPPHPRGPLV